MGLRTPVSKENKKMSDVIKTVRIVREECPGGFCEINETDLTDEMVLFEGEPAAGNEDTGEGGDEGSGEGEPEGDAGEGEGGEADQILNILDGSITEIEEAIGDISDEDLDRLLEAETNGKTRIGAIKAIEAAIDARATE